MLPLLHQAHILFTTYPCINYYITCNTWCSLSILYFTPNKWQLFPQTAIKMLPQQSSVTNFFKLPPNKADKKGSAVAPKSSKCHYVHSIYTHTHTASSAFLISLPVSYMSTTPANQSCHYMSQHLSVVSPNLTKGLVFMCIAYRNNPVSTKFLVFSETAWRSPSCSLKDHTKTQTLPLDQA